MKSLPDKFSRNRTTVCVQGLGFVGSAMSLAVASAKAETGETLYNVIGIDISSEEGCRRVNSFNQGIFPFENNDQALQQAMAQTQRDGNLWATIDPDYFQAADVIIVDINLDLKYKEDHQPSLDMYPFEIAIHTLGQRIRPGALVIVETTVPPGTCAKIAYPVLCEEFDKRGLNRSDIFLAHSYERVMPGANYFDSIINFWRVYSGINRESADKCQVFLESILHTEQYPLTRLENTTATEIAKVLENSYRATNIAFMEEWGRFAEAVGVDLFQVIDAIRMRPTHSNMRQPGFGVGGYCLTKDPYFAPLAAKDIFGFSDLEFPFSTKAVEVNHTMPLVSLNKIETLCGGSLVGRKMLVMGVSYRQDVGDTRYSPTELFVKEASQRGTKIMCQDPLVRVWREVDVPVLQEIPSFTGWDIIVFTVQHNQYLKIDFKTADLSNTVLIFDANRVLSDKQRQDIAQRDVKFASIGR